MSVKIVLSMYLCVFCCKMLRRLCIEGQYLWYRYKLVIFRSINRYKRRFIVFVRILLKYCVVFALKISIYGTGTSSQFLGA